MSSELSEYNLFVQARIDYHKSKTLYMISKRNLNTTEYDFLSNEVLINGMKSYLYIRENATTNSIEELIAKVKTGIEEMAVKSIQNNY